LTMFEAGLRQAGFVMVFKITPEPEQMKIE